ncbi:MAG: ribose-phosphate pyrophosphokinase [Geminicoccaceae bacterium]|nr:MAG: ribose-phosphate pyrophosphokinase [Geminicoccaceae bacterium]
MSFALLSLGCGADLARAVADRLGITPLPVEERGFEDGEHKIRPLERVRGLDLYLVQSLYGEPGLSADEKLVRTLFLAAALRDHGAARVTLVAPYLAYARKDRRTKTFDPVSTRYLAQLVEAVGIVRVVALDVHNPAAFENAFRIETVHLEARGLFVRHLIATLADRPLAVVSPDAGGVKRAEALRRALETAIGRPVPLGLMEKHRSGGVVSGEAFAGEVDGRVALVVDDLVSTGGTMLRCATGCRARGAVEVRAVATHGLFTGEAPRVLEDPAITGWLVTDSVPPFRLPEAARARLRVVPIAPLLAEAIRRLHDGGPLEDLASEPVASAEA